MKLEKKKEAITYIYKRILLLNTTLLGKWIFKRHLQEG